MTERRPSNDDEMREFLSRLEQEFQPRGTMPVDPSPRQEPYAMPPEAVPQQRTIRLRLPSSPARLVYALIAINVLMYLLTQVLASQYANYTAALIVLGAKWNPAIDAGQWWRLLTPMVLHGGLIHLLFNSWALYALGVDAERQFGTARFATVYLLAGLAGSIASYVFNPNVPSVGASGAIFGLIGALGAFAYTVRSLIGAEASKMQLGQIISLALINLLFGFSVPNIDNAAHIGGLIAGGIAGFALAPRYVIDRRFEPPIVARGDQPLVGWSVAGVILVALIAWFWSVSPV
jgi:rhomboid protease GluP